MRADSLGTGQERPRSAVPALVSVLVPAFNHARFVVQALESIRLDGYPRKEVILLDDGSTDETFAVAQTWLEKNGDCFERVQVSTQPNQGVCRTLNRLVSQARGEYVTLLASDDALVDGGIAARVRVLDARPDLLAVFGDAELMGPEGETLAASAMESLYQTDKRMLVNTRAMTRELVLRWAIPGPVLLLRRVSYDRSNVGPYSEDLAAEDRDFYLRLLAANKLAFLDQRVAKYRVHARNLSRAPELKPRMVRDHLSACARNVDRFHGFDRFCLQMSAKGLRHYLRSLEEKGARSIAHRLSHLTLRTAMGALLSTCRAYNAVRPSAGEVKGDS